MFLAIKKAQLQIMLQRKRSYKCSYWCLSPDCKMSQILGWKKPEKDFLNVPMLFGINAKYVPLTF